MFQSKISCLTAIFILTFSFGCGDKSAENAAVQSKSGDQSGFNQINKSNEPANLQTPTPTENRAEETAENNFEGTAGIIKKDYKIKETAVLKEVRAARHENYDRIVFEFQTAEMPGYRIEYVDKPVRQCGSGFTVPVAGDGWLEISLTPAQAHDDKGQAIVEKRDQKFDFPILKQAVMTCDFEAEVAVVLGVAKPNKYRVLELKNPARLAVDIKH